MGRSTAQAEVVIVTNVVGSSFTITRGQDGTLASAQNGGNTFEHIIPASLANRAEAHIAATTGEHGVTGSFVGTTGAQTISDKEYRGHFTHAYADGLPAGVASGFEVTATAATARDGFKHTNTAGDVDRRGFLLSQSGTDRFEVFNDGTVRSTPNTAHTRPAVEARATTAKSALRVGNASAANAQTFDVTGNGNTAIGGTLAVTGAATVTGDVDFALQAGGATGNRTVIRTQPGQVPLSVKDNGGFNVFTIGASGNVDASGYLATASTLSAGGASTLTGDVTLPLPASATTPRLTVNGRTGTALWTGKNQAGTTTSRIDETGYAEHAHRLNIFNSASPVTASVAATTDVPGPLSGQIVWLNSTNSWMRYNGSAWISAETPRGIIGGRAITGTNTLTSGIAATETKPTNMDSTLLSLEKNRRYRVHVRFKASASGTTSTFLVKLKEDTGTSGTTGNQIREYVLIDAADVETRDFFGEYETGGSDVSRAFKITAARISGTDTLDFKGGGSTTTSQVGIWVEDMGPAAKLTVTAS
jgi:hypothetical protein